MKIKTLTGSSIHAALIEARRFLGDDVVLLESIPAEGDTPAKITVMVDDEPAVTRPSESTAAIHGSSAGSYGYASSAQHDASAAVASNRSGTGVNNSGAGVNFSYNGPNGSYSPSANHSAYVQPFTAGRQGRERNELFVPPGNSGSHLPVKADQFKELLESQLKLIHKRLDELDRRFEGAIIGAGIRWASHPLYARLLHQGFRPSTVTRFFEGLVLKGFEPNHEPQKIRWAIAQEIRDALQTATPKRYTGTIMFVGPSGAGKTSLLLKIAKHPSFFGRHKSTVISILPESDKQSAYLNPAALFTRYGIPVQTVRTPEEMDEALDRVNSFDQILIDTPPMPVHEAGARKLLQHVKRLTEPLLPIQVHLVLNATRALDEFEADYIQRLPLKPNVIAFSHLDETRGLGRIAEWMLETKLPIQFASSSPEVPDGVGAFTPGWFVEEMMRII